MSVRFLFSEEAACGEVPKGYNSNVCVALVQGQRIPYTHAVGSDGWQEVIASIQREHSDVFIKAEDPHADRIYDVNVLENRITHNAPSPENSLT